MIESYWKKFCERVRDKQTIAQDEVVIKEAIEALHPGQSYTMTNIDPYRIVFNDNRDYDPVAILTKVKERITPSLTLDLQQVNCLTNYGKT